MTCKRQSQKIVVTFAEILNLQINIANGLIALQKDDMQMIIRRRIVCKSLFTLAADVLALEILRRQFGFSMTPLLYH